MTPEERQLISGLFDRMKPAGSQQRDRDAENLIAEQVRAQPYAPYLLSQTVIVQDQALQAANQKIQQLEAQLQQGSGAQPQQDTSFLGGLGRMFGGGGDQNRGSTVPTTGGHGPGPLPQEPGPFRGQGGGGGPWTQQGQPQGGGMMGGMASAMGGSGGGFLKGALGAAAGVAGGVLLADGIRNLFAGGNNPYGIASGFGQGGLGAGGFGNPGGETIINNYYDDNNNNQGPDAGNYGDGGGGDGGFDPGDGGGGGGGGYYNN